MQSLHLYNHKAVSLFKTLMLGVTWFGGVYRQETPAAFYLFSMAILAEYAIQLVAAKKFIPKILPTVLVVANSLVVLFTLNSLIIHETATRSWLSGICCGTVIVVAVDAVFTILIEPPPPPPHIEHRLANSGHTAVYTF